MKSSLSDTYILLAGGVRSHESGHDPPDVDFRSDFEEMTIDPSAIAGVQPRPIRASELPGGGEDENTMLCYFQSREDHVLVSSNDDEPSDGASRRSNRSITKPGQFIMDSAAGVSVANETSWIPHGARIMQLPPGASNLSGVGGDKTRVTAISALFEPLGFMNVNHARNSVANIISLPDLQERAYIHFRDQRTANDRIEISADEEGEVIIGVAPKDPITRFYMLQAPALASPRLEETIPILNIYSDAYAKGWSKNSIVRALKVRGLHRAFSFAGLHRLKALARTNQFGTDIGLKEVSLYEELHDAGDCAACRMGKTVKSPQVTPEYTRSTRIGELIVADIMEIKSKRLRANKLVLVAVDDSSAYTHVKYLPKKNIDSVVAALEAICRDYSSFGWTVSAIKLDGDGAFAEIAPHIAIPLGVAIIPTSPYKHAVIAERMIRTLSTLFRCTLASLPYTLSPHMFVNMLEYCASSNNLVPNDHNPVLSPTELYTGRSPEYHKLMEIEYGKLVTFYHDSTQNDEMRAKVGVIVGRDVRRPGHAQIWDLLGGGVVTRNDFKSLSWNQALLKAYIDTAMGAHQAEDLSVDRSTYYEPTDVELSSEDVHELCEDESAEPGNLQQYKDMREAADTEEDSLHVNKPAGEHRQALLRLIDVANASGHLLSNEDEERDSEALDTEKRDAEENPTLDQGEREPRDHDGLSRSMAAELKGLLSLYSEEVRKPARRQNVSVLQSTAERIKNLRSWIELESSGAASVGHTVVTSCQRGRPNLPKPLNQVIREIDTRNLIPSRNTNGAIFTYYGTAYHILNLSVKQAFAKLGEDETAQALVNEMLQMSEKGVWEAKSVADMRELYRLGRVKNVLPCSVFLKEKYDATKKYIKLKARLVAHGNRQILDDLFGAKDVDSPTVSLAVVFILLQMAAAGNWAKRVIDVAGAYLNADLKEPEYMRIPANVVELIEQQLRKDGTPIESTKQQDGSVIVELKKALYGLRQAGREWYTLLSSFLIECGYKRSDADKCLFSRTEGQTVSYLAVYVDDILVVSNKEEEVQRVTKMLGDRFHSITIQEGADISFVGIEIHTEPNGDVKIRQKGYISDILKHFDIASGDTSAYPCTDNIMEAQKPGESDFDPSRYKSAVMKMMYLSTRTRPDIAFVVSALACRSERPHQQDWDRLIHLAKYLNGTQDEYLIFRQGGSIQLSAFVDASFMTHRDMRGHTGYCIFADNVGSAAILFRSVKQKTVADSSTEAEVIALHELVQHLLWIISVYESIGVRIQKPVEVHNDNQSNLILHSKDHINFKGKSKYIARKYFSVFEHVEDGTLKLVWTGTDNLVADFLTKAVQGGKFKKFKITIGLQQ